MCNTHVNTHAHTASFNRSLGEQLCSHWVKDTKKNMLLKIKINNCCEMTQSHRKFPLERHWTAPGCCRGRSETPRAQPSGHSGSQEHLLRSRPDKFLWALFDPLADKGDGRCSTIFSHLFSLAASASLQQIPCFPLCRGKSEEDPKQL